jgi:hypothetical protein
MAISLSSSYLRVERMESGILTSSGKGCSHDRIVHVQSLTTVAADQHSHGLIAEYML